MVVNQAANHYSNRSNYNIGPLPSTYYLHSDITVSTHSVRHGFKLSCICIEISIYGNFILLATRVLILDLPNLLL